jgi:hypothetical protein
MDWLTVPAGAMTTGMLGAYAYNKLVKKLGEYNDVIGNLDASSEIHPMYDAAGELVAFGAGLPRAGMRLAGRALESAAKATEDVRAVSKSLQALAKAYGTSGGGLVYGISNLSKQAALQIAGGATRQRVAQTILNDILLRAGTAALADTALKEAGKGLGLSKGETWGGAGHAALLGMLTMGHGLGFENYSAQQVGDIILRAQARETLQVPAGRTLTASDLAALAKAKGLDVGAISGNVSAPLTPKEMEVYRKVQAAINDGQIPVDLNGVLANARQVLAAGQPKGIVAVKAEAAAEDGASGKTGGGVQDFLKKPVVTNTANATSRRAIAQAFYKASGKDDATIEKHLNGVDFNKPVDITTLPKGTQVVQYQDPNNPVGNYFAPVGTPAESLGIDPKGRVAKIYTTTRDVTVLRSTAADTRSNPAVPRSQRGNGGGIQYFAQDTSAFTE